MKTDKKILITTGDPKGIGVEITEKAISHFDRKNIDIISNSKIFNGKVDFEIENPENSGEFSFQSLKRACELIKTNKYKALVTAPISKEALYDADHFYNGQTEVLESFLAHDNQKAEMLFVAKDFRVLLLTRHVALKSIQLSKSQIINKIKILHNFLQEKHHINEPRIALCAFNPHAGENGLFGKEEIDVLNPAVEQLNNEGIHITNPLPADTLFVNAGKNYLNNKAVPYDCYVACYHDQGLIPIKTLASDYTVNTTIGLDIIRTSPAHGTAFDIAGKGIANESSMIEAIKHALNY
jgi:4-hydroxythreonine-4-phosphate dehydrogenase